jgi:hypothetical protein
MSRSWRYCGRSKGEGRSRGFAAREGLASDVLSLETAMLWGRGERAAGPAAVAEEGAVEAVSGGGVALRRAYAIGICSVEEIGPSLSHAKQPAESKKLSPQPAYGNHGGARVAIVFARLFAGISSIPTWSRPMPPISAVRRLCARPTANG